ncbi:hypothetical protein [Nonomuraea sp. NPDC003804]|uniref:hypothetical protein n=1 Tax=Nonomuraea sp. NPDC003804 TaxID=3154547 RepID=UPI0033A290C0
MAGRARIAVGKAIRRVLARVAEADPVIADEPPDTVRTVLRLTGENGPAPGYLMNR